MRNFYLRTAKVITIFNTYVFYLCSLMVFLIVGSITIDVFFRYFLSAPTKWGMELASMLFGPYFMLAGAHLLHIKGHVNVDIFYEKLSHNIKLYFDITTLCIIILLSFMFFLKSYPLALESYLNKETSFTTWNPLVWPVKVVIPISLIMLTLQALSELVFLTLTIKRIEQEK